MELRLEVKEQTDKTVRIGNAGMMTPAIDEDYWIYRVRVSERQSVVAFPKFGTIGIGFAAEDYDWNTNLPYRSEAEDIYKHIAKNKGDDSICEDDCLAAIRLIQAAAEKFMAVHR